jgi:two-component system OmpR family sensor kinase
VAVLAFTVILLSSTIAVIALTTLRASLVQQLDGELRMLASRVMFAASAPSAIPGAGVDALELAFEGPGVVSGAMAIVGDGTGLTGVYVDESYTVQRMDEERVLHLLDGWGDDSRHEADPGVGAGVYRFAGEQRGMTTVIVGLPLAGVEQTVSTVALTIGIVALGGCLVLGALAAWYIRREMRPLERVAAAAEHIAGSPLDRGDVELRRAAAPGASAAAEIGRLVSGFTSMIDQVARAFRVREASEAKVRRFVADASHELRTPLASIRGYSELTRRMAEDLPDDAAYALGRIESESVRMTSLVEDLLLLARLDEGQELERLSVDLTRLIGDAVNDVRIVGPEHEWLLELPAQPVIVVGDARRLHQAVVNLLTNARVHTPPGTRVTVLLEDRPERAVIEVRDTGPGIPPDRLPELFERFTRGDDSRARATGSTGLGLAIVQGIVEGHGGEVHATSRAGDTRFSLELPRDGSAGARGGHSI